MAFKLVTGKIPIAEREFATLNTRGLILVPKSVIDAYLPKSDLVAIYYEKATKRVGIKASKDKSIGRKISLNKKTNTCFINAQNLFEEGVKVQKAIKSPVTFNKRFGGIIFSIAEQAKAVKKRKPGRKPKSQTKQKKGRPGRPKKAEKDVKRGRSGTPPKKAE